MTERDNIGEVTSSMLLEGYRRWTDDIQTEDAEGYYTDALIRLREIAARADQDMKLVDEFLQLWFQNKIFGLKPSQTIRLAPLTMLSAGMPFTSDNDVKPDTIAAAVKCALDDEVTCGPDCFIPIGDDHSDGMYECCDSGSRTCSYIYVRDFVIEELYLLNFWAFLESRDNDCPFDINVKINELIKLSCHYKLWSSRKQVLLVHDRLAVKPAQATVNNLDNALSQTEM